jgi:hypothetical protein
MRGAWILAGLLALGGCASLRGIWPYEEPDLAKCSLEHGFVIGEGPGTVELWTCEGRPLVTLNEIEHRGNERKTVTRNHFYPSLGQGERLMGCRGRDENFDGTIALASGPTFEPELKRAWKADLKKWSWARTSPAGLVCNRGLAIN